MDHFPDLFNYRPCVSSSYEPMAMNLTVSLPFCNAFNWSNHFYICNSPFLVPTRLTSCLNVHKCILCSQGLLLIIGSSFSGCSSTIDLDPITLTSNPHTLGLANFVFVNVSQFYQAYKICFRDGYCEFSKYRIMSNYYFVRIGICPFS